MKTFDFLHKNHQGKVSDKWDIYLKSYETILASYRNQPINLLEIGVQNGGSLEIWTEYFPNAQNIIGCDINPKCAELQYDNPCIHIVIGNAVEDSTQQAISSITPQFDIIIDDGSHTSGDIIRTFARYFDQLQDGGVFIFEDLHCSYWQEYEGGLYHPHSSINFFKQLVDVINYEHWALPIDRNEVLRDFYQHYDSLAAIDLSHIHSIEFINSICVITKRSPVENELGRRIASGTAALVDKQPILVAGRKSIAPDQSATPYPLSSKAKISLLDAEIVQKTMELLSAKEELSSLNSEIAQKSADLLAAKADIQIQQSQISKLLSNLEHLETEANDLRTSNKTKETTIQDLNDKLNTTEHNINSLNKQLEHLSHLQHDTAKQYAKYKQLWIIKLLKPLIKTEQAISSANRYRKAFHRLVKEKGSIGKAYQYLRKHYKQTKSWRSTKQLLKQTSSKPVFAHMDSTVELPPIPTLLIQPVTKSAEQTCTLKVAIIAEMSIPQCKKYRVTQKQEMLEAAGIPCSVTSWTDYDEARRQISLASTVIFYRVPGFDSVMSLIDECQRLKIKTYWDVDDLIFDEDILKSSSTINSLDKEERKGVITGARLYRKAMLACNEGIASTSGLAKIMQNAGLQTVHVIENALDKETLATAEKIGNRAKLSDGIVRIIYGSGTKTHNIDFMEAAPALAETLKKYPNVRFRYIGFLELPDYFDAVKAQIEHIPFCSYPEYLAHLAECDISIAPLENFIFNDAKSNIKYLEASITHLVSVCSPRAAFVDVIEHGKTGMLADSDEQWLAAFENLIQDAELRQNITKAANENVMARYSPDAVGKLLADIVNDEAYAQQQQTKVMTFNVYYAPQSFGGATIVAEQINKLLASDDQHQVYAVTTLPVTHYLKPYHTIRYEYNGVTVFGVAVPPEDSAAYENPRFSAAVEEIIGLVKPDISHLHCIQGIGVEIVDVCKQHGIKTIVTLHDAWWICPNQFMLDDKNRFREDWDLNEFPQRYRAVGNALAKIDMAISPSQYFTDLHKRKTDRAVYTNKNGVLQPKERIEKHKQPTIRFGYVGGMTEIKGVHLILAAFKKYNFADTELVIVDNMLNMGSQSFFDEQLQGISHYKIVPAYNQDTIDEFFSGIDVLLFPTQWKESFGLTVREAMLRDVWVIATDAGGVSEDIIDGENGTVIPFDSGIEELSEAIREVCKRYQAMEENAVISLPKAHIRTFEEQKDELVEMYQKLLSEKQFV